MGFIILSVYLLSFFFFTIIPLKILFILLWFFFLICHLFLFFLFHIYLLSGTLLSFVFENVYIFNELWVFETMYFDHIHTFPKSSKSTLFPTHQTLCPLSFLSFMSSSSSACAAHTPLDVWPSTGGNFTKFFSNVLFFFHKKYFIYQR